MFAPQTPSTRAHRWVSTGRTAAELARPRAWRDAVFGLTGAAFVVAAIALAQHLDAASARHAVQPAAAAASHPVPAIAGEEH